MIVATPTLESLQPMILGIMTTFVMQGLRHASPRVEALSTNKKRFIVVGIASTVTALTALSGVFYTNENSAQMTLESLINLVTVLFTSFGVHQVVVQEPRELLARPPVPIVVVADGVTVVATPLVPIPDDPSLIPIPEGGEDRS